MMTKNSLPPPKKTLSLNLDDSKDSTKLQQKLQQLKDFYANGMPAVEESDKTKKNVSSPASRLTNEPVSPRQKPAAGAEVVDKSSKDSTLPDVAAIQKEAKRKRFEQLKLALTWLQETYPLCFKAEAPVPLKKRIEKDIFSELPEGLPFSKVSMREALHYYTSSPQYRTNLMTATHRYNLQGDVMEEVTPAEQQLAAEQLALFTEKKKQWAEKKKKFVKKPKVSTPD